VRPFHAALSGRLAERGQTNQLLTRGCPRNRVPDTTTSVHHHTHSCLALQATLTTIKTRLSSTRTCSVETQRHNTHTRSQCAQDGRVGPIYHCRCTETPVFFLSWALLIALCIPKRRVIHLPSRGLVDQVARSIDSDSVDSAAGIRSSVGRGASQRGLIGVRPPKPQGPLANRRPQSTTPASQPSVSANPTPDGILAYSARLHVVPVQCDRYLRLRFSTTHVRTRVLEPAEWRPALREAAQRIDEKKAAASWPAAA